MREVKCHPAGLGTPDTASLGCQGSSVCFSHIPGLLPRPWICCRDPPGQTLALAVNTCPQVLGGRILFPSGLSSLPPSRSKSPSQSGLQGLLAGGVNLCWALCPESP